MSTKLDPMLAALVERVEAGEGSGSDEIAVMVALRAAAGAADRAELEAAGFHMRSVAGDVVTGTVEVADLPRLAAQPQVVAIEAGRPMEPEALR